MAASTYTSLTVYAVGIGDTRELLRSMPYSEAALSRELQIAHNRSRIGGYGGTRLLVLPF